MFREMLISAAESSGGALEEKLIEFPVFLVVLVPPHDFLRIYEKSRGYIELRSRPVLR